MSVDIFYKCKTLIRLKQLQYLILLTKELWYVAGHHLVEDMVASLFLKLECHSRLLQQIYKC